MALTQQFIFFLATLSLLIIVLFAFGAYKGASDPAFGGWKWAPPNGLFWQIAMLSFVYSALFSDVVFIRLAVVLANLFITAWVTLGVAHWPDYFQFFLAEIHIDQFIWAAICIIPTVIPMLRQFHYDDANKEFDVGDQVAVAEKTWRDWFRLSGIPRSDFKIIVEAGSFVTFAPGQAIPLLLDSKSKRKAGSDSDTSDSEDDDDEDIYAHDKFENVFYYIVRGTVQVFPGKANGRQPFTLEQGQFLDSFALMVLLGHSNLCKAMQTQPLQASATTEVLVLSWTRDEMVGKVLRTNGFAADCLRLVLCQATVDQLFLASINPDFREDFDRMLRMRQMLQEADLPKGVANPDRSIWSQFKAAHISLHDLWYPSPHQRVVNAAATGSRELSMLHMLRVCNRDMIELTETKQ